MQQMNFLGERPTPKPPTFHPDLRGALSDEAFRRSMAYQKYIKSARWRNTREDMFKRFGRRCQRCPATTSLELHHITYERFGRELPRDLEILCTRCHDDADRERQARLALQFEELRATRSYENARETYFTKRYGDFQYVTDGMLEEFDRWISRKDDGR